MNFIQKILRISKNCIKAITYKWEKGKSLFLLDISIGLLRESKSIIAMLLPALIIQLVADVNKIDRVLLIIFLVCVVMTIVSILIEVTQRALSNHSYRALNYIILKLNKKAMRINLDKFEDSECLKDFDKAYDGAFNASDVDFTIFSVILSKSISLAITAYIFSTVHYLLAIFIIISLIVEFILSIRLSERLHEKDQIQSGLSHKKNYISSVLFDCKTNKDIFLNGAKDFFISKFQNSHDDDLEIEKDKKRDVLKNDSLSAIIEMVRTTFIYIFAVFRYVAGALPVSNFVLFSSAAKQMTYAIWQIFESFISIYRASDYFEDYNKYLNINESLAEEGNSSLDLSDKESDWVIEFKNVGYKYQNQENFAVRNLSFVISKNETIAIVGDNGAGKSTVVKLLLRLYHVTEGDILLNGKSIYSYKYDEYMSFVSAAFQDFMIYAFTIRENILFDKDIKKEELDILLQYFELDKKIDSLPKGLDTNYTKQFYADGVEFSGGEEQKLVIARAFAKRSNIIVLDEPTAAIDPISEFKLFETIRELRENHTILFISHRMSTTRYCDRIIVINDGSIKETGNHFELMRKKGLYYKMFNMQTQYYK